MPAGCCCGPMAPGAGEHPAGATRPATGWTAREVLREGAGAGLQGEASGCERFPPHRPGHARTWRSQVVVKGRTARSRCMVLLRYAANNGPCRDAAPAAAFSKLTAKQVKGLSDPEDVEPMPEDMPRDTQCAETYLDARLERMGNVNWRNIQVNLRILLRIF